MSQTYDVIILGAGPAGMAAAIYTGRARLNTLVLEKGLPGGQILLTDWVENYPGFPDGVVPFQLMDNFRKQAAKFGAKIETDKVKDVRRKDSLWLVLGNRGKYQARAVIIATGSDYRKLGLEGETRLTGRGISYCATCDGAFFKDKVIGVIGGGDNALTEALFLTRFCRLVKVIHRRNQFRAEKILQERIFENSKIEVLWDSVIEKISGKDKLKSITIMNVKDKSFSEIKLDGLFISIGMDPNTGFVKGLIDLNKLGQVKVNKTMATSEPGIFAAGDVTDACPEQMATAVGTGVAAALAVDEYLS
ncbi:MAG: thioredoxin-disulfide reductase, partial [Candidatus Aminicenantes bacterium]